MTTTPTDAAETRASYTHVAVTLHWIIAFLILAQVPLGWQLHVLQGAARYAAFQLHKSIGISVLLLSLMRLAWRVAHPAPPEEPMPRWQHVASAIVHWGLYAIMIGLPLTGWIMVSSSKLAIPTLLFGVIPWPSIPILPTLAPAAKAAWSAFGGTSHVVLVYTTMTLLILHLAAVVKHQLFDRDRVFARMAPGAQAGWREPRFWIVAALIVVASMIGRNIMSLSGAHHAGQGHAATAPTPVAPAPIGETAPAIAPPGPQATAPDETAKTTDASAKAAQWKVQSGQLGFSTSWSGAAIVGSFARWTADIVFSPDALKQSSLKVGIDIGSASTGDSQRDAALPTADWFDTVTHPAATFRSHHIRSTGGNGYVADGTLELRGVRHDLALPFTVRITNGVASAHGSFTLDRTTFGVGQGEWAATDQIPAGVAVTFSLRAKAEAGR